jgi:hypothetical protein
MTAKKYIQLGKKWSHIKGKQKEGKQIGEIHTIIKRTHPKNTIKCISKFTQKVLIKVFILASLIHKEENLREKE